MKPAPTERLGYTGRYDRLLYLACRSAAILGGVLLLAIAIMTTLSIVGRFFFNAPIPGDFELVEVGCVIAVFLFLPYCQIEGGNIVVDIVTAGGNARRNRILDGVGALLYGLIAGVLTWRMTLGGIDMFHYDEQTMILGLARWWGFVPVVLATALLTLVCLSSAWRHLRANPR